MNEYESNDEAETRLLQQISQQCAEYLNCYDSERITGIHELRQPPPLANRPGRTCMNMQPPFTA